MPHKKSVFIDEKRGTRKTGEGKDRMYKQPPLSRIIPRSRVLQRPWRLIYFLPNSLHKLH